MKYLQKSFSVGGPIQVSQEDWDAIFHPRPESWTLLDLDTGASFYSLPLEEMITEETTEKEVP
jgi:hypothetical protein